MQQMTFTWAQEKLHRKRVISMLLMLPLLPLRLAAPRLLSSKRLPRYRCKNTHTRFLWPG